MKKSEKDLKLENDKLSEEAVPDEEMEQVAGGSSFEEFRRYSRKEDKVSAVIHSSLRQEKNK